MISDQLTSRRRPSKKLVLACDCGCGETFLRYKNKVTSGRNFADRQHAGRFKTETYLQEMCGPYVGLVTEYLNGAASTRYLNTCYPRPQLCPFFCYMCTRDVGCISGVTPAHITEFKAWAADNGYSRAANDTSALRIFFDWLIIEELYLDENPVIPSVHGKQNKPKTGRSYTESEMKEIRRLLKLRGNERLRAFFEIAAESGMRSSEICRLRLHDLSIDTKNFKVQLPNKTMKERIAFFRDGASSAILDWLEVRRMDAEHDHLFHNYLGDPLTTTSIQKEFKRALCKSYEGRFMNDEGLESFSIHRLRHTLSSTLADHGADANTLMSVLGWAALSSVDGYTRLSKEAKVRGFVSAMAEVEEQRDRGVGKQILTLEEFLLLRRCEAA